jgi:hypothetical protein
VAGILRKEFSGSAGAGSKNNTFARTPAQNWQSILGEHQKTISNAVNVGLDGSPCVIRESDLKPFHHEILKGSLRLCGPWEESNLEIHSQASATLRFGSTAGA